MKWQKMDILAQDSDSKHIFVFEATPDSTKLWNDFILESRTSLKVLFDILTQESLMNVKCFDIDF